MARHADGDPLHQLQNGALLIFTFFMISDPKTTPDSRAGRMLFACLVAAGATLIQFGMHRTNGLLWSLAATALLVPVIDRLLPGARYQWNPKPSTEPTAPSPPVAAPRSARERGRIGWRVPGTAPAAAPSPARTRAHAEPALRHAHERSTS